MRSNGLTAPSYIPVADLDPRMADSLLVDLKDQGVAAYTRPVESSSTSGLDRPEPREGGALDRLYVDAAESEQVRRQLSEKDPSLLTGSDDLTWAQIVAGFDQPVTGQVNPWPAHEDLDPAPSADEDRGAAAGSDPDRVSADDEDLAQGRRSGGGHDLRGWLAERNATAASYDSDDQRRSGREAEDDPHERFVPPPPPPLPRLEPYQQLCWAGVLGGPLLLLFSVLFSLQLPTWLSVLCVGGFVAGFVTLVARMDEGGEDDDTGNGAVV